MEEKIKELLQEVYMEDKAEKDISIFFKDIIQEVTHQMVEVSVDEISDVKYGVQVISQEKIFWMIAKAWDSTREVIENIKGVIEELDLNQGNKRKRRAL